MLVIACLLATNVKLYLLKTVNIINKSRTSKETKGFCGRIGQQTVGIRY